MKYFTEVPVSSDMLHSKLSLLVDKVVEISLNEDEYSFSSEDVDNIRAECEFRLGILQARSESFGNPILAYWLKDGKLTVLKVIGEESEESTLDLASIAKGFEEIYIGAYVQNVIDEIDPFVDYDVCMVLCGMLDPMDLLDYDEYSDEDYL